MKREVEYNPLTNYEVGGRKKKSLRIKDRVLTGLDSVDKLLT